MVRSLPVLVALAAGCASKSEPSTASTCTDKPSSEFGIPCEQRSPALRRVTCQPGNIAPTRQGTCKLELGTRDVAEYCCEAAACFDGCCDSTGAITYGPASPGEVCASVEKGVLCGLGTPPATRACKERPTRTPSGLRVFCCAK